MKTLTRLAIICFVLSFVVNSSIAQTVFQRTYNHGVADFGYSIEQTDDGGSIIASRSSATT